MIPITLVAGFIAVMVFLFFYATGTPRDRRMMRVTLLFGAIFFSVISTLLFLTGQLHH